MKLSLRPDASSVNSHVGGREDMIPKWPKWHQNYVWKMMCWTRKSHLQQQKASIKVLLLVLLSVDLLGDGNPYLCITFNKMEKYEPFPLLGLSIPFSASNRFVFDRSFRNRMLYIRNLAATFGQLFTCCYLWSKPLFSIAFDLKGMCDSIIREAPLHVFTAWEPGYGICKRL